MLIHRVWTALIFAPALLYVVWRGGLALQLACLGVAGVMLWEALRLLLGAKNYLSKGVAYVLGLGLVAGLYGWLPAGLGKALIPAGTMLVLMSIVVRPEPIDGSSKRAGAIAIATLYGAGLFPFIALLRDVSEVGLGLSLAAIFCTWGADTGAYFAGRAFGRHKLYPIVSPGKTMEGAVGGIVSAVGSAFLIRWLFEVPWGAADTAALGAVAGVFGIIGDLAESLLKRCAGQKDSSRLIPGHGGVLDRFDGVMFAAPAVFVYATLAL